MTENLSFGRGIVEFGLAELHHLQYFHINNRHFEPRSGEKPYLNNTLAWLFYINTALTLGLRSCNSSPKILRLWTMEIVSRSVPATIQYL